MDSLNSNVASLSRSGFRPTNNACLMLERPGTVAVAEVVVSSV